MLEKPSELLLYRPVEEGGLGLYKQQQTLDSSNLSTTPFFTDNSVPDLALPPYYSRVSSTPSRMW